MDEKQRLIMEVVNAEKVERLTKILETEKETIQQLTEQLRQGVITQAQFAAAADGPAQAAVSAKKQIDALQASTRNVGQAALTASQALQDFTQGGLGGILNNIPGLVQQLGGPAGLAAAIGGIGVAVYVLKGPFLEFVDWVSSGSNAVPKMRDAIKEMDDELKTTKERLEALGGGYGLTNEELAEYKQLSAEVLTVERERNAEAERRVGIAKALKEEEEARRSPEAAKAAKQAIEGMGGINDAATAARVAMEAQSPELAAARANANAVRDANAADATSFDPKRPMAMINAQVAIRKAEAARDAVARQIEKQSQDMVLKAREGDQDAIGQLAGLVPNQGFEGGTREILEAEKQRKEAAARSVKEREEWEKREAQRQEQAAKDRETADKDEERTTKKEKADADRLAQQRQREQDALMKPFRDADAREALAAMRDEDERALNGGFTGAETEQLAVSNMAGFRAQQGQATPGELQKIIAENQAMMRQLEEAGGDGSAAMSAFAQVQSQLLWALGQLRQQQQMNNAWRQMQPINGTLMDRGGG